MKIPADRYAKPSDREAILVNKLQESMIAELLIGKLTHEKLSRAAKRRWSRTTSSKPFARNPLGVNTAGQERRSAAA